RSLYNRKDSLSQKGRTAPPSRHLHLSESIKHEKALESPEKQPFSQEEYGFLQSPECFSFSKILKPVLPGTDPSPKLHILWSSASQSHSLRREEMPRQREDLALLQRQQNEGPLFHHRSPILNRLQ